MLSAIGLSVSGESETLRSVKRRGREGDIAKNQFKQIVPIDFQPAGPRINLQYGGEYLPPLSLCK